MFDGELKIAVTLRNDKKMHVAVGECVKGCALELSPVGFSGRVTLWSDLAKKDDLAAWFLDPALMEIELRIEPTHAERKEIEAARITVAGLVTDRAMREVMVGKKNGKDIVEREYTVAFADPAALLWQQHRPLELRADGKVKAILEEHLAGHIRLDCSLADADKTRPIVCVPSGECESSFYDFVLWYADRAGGAWQYDYFAKSYRLAASRSSHAAREELQLGDVAAVRVHVAAPLRHSARVLNAHSEAAQTAPVDLAHAVEGIARDRLIRSPSSADFDAAKEIEKKRLHKTLPEVEIDLARYPLVPLMPGAKAALRHEHFGDAIHPTKKPLRVLRLSLRADAADTTRANRSDVETRVYHTALALTLEHDDDERTHLPPHRAPVWPIFVEGTIVSEIGEASDRTFMPSDDKEHYVVHVPLWNQKVKVPFGPQFVPGHFFAPAFKGSRVLLALHFEHAEIARFLDWGSDVRLPHESQGNHLLFGKNAKSQTSLKHAYVDDKPVLSLTRVREADQGRVQLEEGLLVLEIKEDHALQAAGESHDLTAKAAATQAQLEGGAQDAVGKIKASNAKGKATLDGKLAGARGALSGALESLDADISGKAEAGKAELQARSDSIDGKVGEMKARFEAKRGELQAKRGKRE